MPRPVHVGARQCAFLTRALVSLALLGANYGCKEASEPFGVVRGVVTYQRAPVPNAVVIFESTEGQLEISAEANEQGAFEARRSMDVPGLPLGEYRVAVTPPLFYPGLGPVGQNPGPPVRHDIPERFRSTATSGLTLRVPEEGKEIKFNIEMNP